MTQPLEVREQGGAKWKAAAKVEELVAGEGFDVEKFVENFEVLAEAEGGVKKLRELAIELATKGLLLEGSDRSSWKEVTLADVVLDLQNGISKRRGDVGDPVPVLRLADIEAGVRLRAADLREIVLTEAEQQKYAVTRGDILVIRVNGSGELVGRFIACEVDRAWAYSDHLIRVRLRTNLVDPAFLCALSRSAAARTHLGTKTVTTAGQKTINQQGLSSLPLLLPPLAEQKRIVAKVDQLMALCDELEARQTKTRETGARLTKSALDALTSAEGPEEFDAAWKRVVENFDVLIDRAEKVGAVRGALVDACVAGRLTKQRQDWPIMALRDIATDTRYGTSRKCDRDTTLVPVLRIPNVVSGKLVLDDLKYTSFPGAELAELQLRAGDLLVVRSNGSRDLVGRACVVDSRANDFAFAGYLIRIRVKSELALPQWLQLTFESSSVRRAVEGPARTTSGVHNLNTKELLALSVPVPGLDAQADALRTMSPLIEVCNTLEAKLRAAEDLATRLAQAVAQRLVGL